MPSRILPRSFYSRSPIIVGRELLGARLVRKIDGQLLIARIVETEAYLGEDDPASHASMGRTPRNAVMFGPPGHAYVYFTYGMHHCMNVVTGIEGVASAVLLRAAEPLEGLGLMRERRKLERAELLLSGPARLAQAFGLSREHTGSDMTRGELVIREGPKPAEKVRTSPRIGIRKAVEKPWRFYLEGNPHVSRAPR